MIFVISSFYDKRVFFFFLSIICWNVASTQFFSIMFTKKKTGCMYDFFIWLELLFIGKRTWFTVYWITQTFEHIKPMINGVRMMELWSTKKELASRSQWNMLPSSFSSYAWLLQGMLQTYANFSRLSRMGCNNVLCCAYRLLRCSHICFFL